MDSQPAQAAVSASASWVFLDSPCERDRAVRDDEARAAPELLRRVEVHLHGELRNAVGVLRLGLVRLDQRPLTSRGGAMGAVVGGSKVSRLAKNVSESTSYFLQALPRASKRVLHTPKSVPKCMRHG